MIRKHNVWIYVICFCVLFGLTGCGAESKWVFSVNGEELSLEEVNAFGYIYAEKYNIVDPTQLFENYEEGMTYEDYYKQKFQDEVVRTLLYYSVAKKDGVSLKKEQRQEVREQTESLLERLGKEYLKQQKVDESDLMKIYEMQAMMNQYILSTKDAVSQENEGNANRYVEVFEVLFPTVQIDSRGMIVTDENGNLKHRLPDTVEKMKEDAMNFSIRWQSGEKIEELKKEFSYANYNEHLYLKYEDLKGDYKKTVEALASGKISSAFSAEYGYYVIKMIDMDATEYAQTIQEHEQVTEQNTVQMEEENRLYNTYVGAGNDYMNADLWDEVNIAQYIR